MPTTTAHTRSPERSASTEGCSTAGGSNGTVGSTDASPWTTPTVGSSTAPSGGGGGGGGPSGGAVTEGGGATCGRAAASSTAAPSTGSGAAAPAAALGNPSTV